MASDPINEQALPGATPLPAQEAVTLSSVRTVYGHIAPIYDWAFKGVFQQGRRLTIKTLSPQPGDRVLEVGVGTGLTLRHWPRHARVTGIDLSPEMLQRATRARLRHQLEHVDLRLMNAQAMEFPDNAFDKIAAMYVVSVAPDPSALLREVQRVCVPGGRICIVNHFKHSNGLLAKIEAGLSKYARFIGWDSALPLERVTERPGLVIRRIHRVNLGGYWTLIEAENIK